MHPDVTRIALRTSIGYWLFSALWIALLTGFLSGHAAIDQLEAYHGWAFATASAILLYAAMRAQLDRCQQRAAREGEERYRALVETSTDGFLMVDTSGRLLEVNDIYLRRSGYTRKELLRLRVADIEAREKPEETAAHIERIRREGRGLFQTLHRARDGSVWPVEINAVYWPIDGGCFLVFARDITKRVEAERHVRAADMQLRAAIESLDEIFLLCDPQDRIVLTNRYWREFNQLEDSSILGAHFEDFLRMLIARGHAPEARGREEEFLRQSMARHRAEDSRFEIQRRGRWVHMHKHRLPDGSMISVGMDITERKQAEESLRTLSRAVEQSPVSIVITDNAGNIQYVNPRFEIVTGYSRGEVLGLNPRILKSDVTPRTVYEQLWRTITTGDEWRGELCNRKKNGDLFWESASISGLQDERGNIAHFVAVKEDITERKQAEEDLRRSRRQLQELSASLQAAREEERMRISRELHDELGQQLMGLKMDLSWIKSRLHGDQEGLAAKIAGMKKLIESTAASMRRIASELRPLVLDDLGLASAIDWLGRDFSQRTGIEVRMEVDEIGIELDRALATAVFRIVQESLTNVARHAGATRADILLRNTGALLNVEVRDDGRGMPADAADRKSFGMIGMRERAYMHGGEMTVVSAAGRGTTVRVTLPLAKSQIEELHR